MLKINRTSSILIFYLLHSVTQHGSPEVAKLQYKIPKVLNKITNESVFTEIMSIC